MTMQTTNTAPTASASFNQETRPLRIESRVGHFPNVPGQLGLPDLPGLPGWYGALPPGIAAYRRNTGASVTARRARKC